MIEIGVNRFRSKAAASPEHNAGSGGNVDDFSKRLDMFDERLGKLEVGMGELRSQMPFVATKADVVAIDAKMEFFATKADVHAQSVQMIKWMIGTAISCATMAFAAAKLIH